MEIVKNYFYQKLRQLKFIVNKEISENYYNFFYLIPLILGIFIYIFFSKWLCILENLKESDTIAEICNLNWIFSNNFLLLYIFITLSVFLCVCFSKNIYKILSIFLFLICLSFTLSVFKIKNLHHNVIDPVINLHLNIKGKIVDIQYANTFENETCIKDNFVRNDKDNLLKYDVNALKKCIPLKCSLTDNGLNYLTRNDLNKANFTSYGLFPFNKVVIIVKPSKIIFNNQKRKIFRNTKEKLLKLFENIKYISIRSNKFAKIYFDSFNVCACCDYSNGLSYLYQFNHCVEDEKFSLPYVIGNEICADVILFKTKDEFNVYNIYAYLNGISGYCALTRLYKNDCAFFTNNNLNMVNDRKYEMNGVQLYCSELYSFNDLCKCDGCKKTFVGCCFGDICFQKVKNCYDVVNNFFLNNVVCVRAYINKLINYNLSHRNRPIAKALITGDKLSLPKCMREDFAHAGIAHLLAISGLHMCILGGIFFFLFRHLFCSFEYCTTYWNIRKISLLLTILVMFFYLQIANSAIPALRAFVMFFITALSVLFNKNVSSLRNVSNTALIFMLISPEIVFFPGFHMSIIAVISIIAFYEKYKNLNKYLLFFLSNIFVSFILSSITLYVFSQYSLYAPLINVVAIPFMTFCLMPSIVLFFIILCLKFLFVFVFQRVGSLCNLLSCVVQSDKIDVRESIDFVKLCDFSCVLDYCKSLQNGIDFFQYKFLDVCIDFLFVLIDFNKCLLFADVEIPAPKFYLLFCFLFGFFIYAFFSRLIEKFGIFIMSTSLIFYIISNW